ncbi:pyridoxal phosphate-dependent decarboxylase family protein [Enhygromyxa salina]|nr:aminotransferase class V-fold PLP-dependent enzyme [Enhygromyxa salina]
MPLDPDDIRTPSPTLDADADLASEPMSDEPPAAPTRLPVRPSPSPSPNPRLIDQIDDRDLAAAPPQRAIPDGPAPHPFFAPLGEPVDRHTLEPDAGTRSMWMREVSDHVLELLRTIPLRSAQGRVGAAGQRLAEQHRAPIDEQPIAGGLPRALELIAGSMDAALETAGPGYLAYVPGGGLYSSALADLIANVGNRFTGYAMAAPGWVRLEHDVLAWLAQEFGYDQRARGLLTPGSSMANFTALVTARHHCFGDTGDYSRAIVYTSTQGHHSIAKAVRMAGIPVANLRAVAVDELFRLDVEDLRAQLEADRHRGLRPFCVIAAAGTTNTGAIDPLPELAQLCADEDLWLHVDGAYGGAFVLSPSGRPRLRGIELADSLCFDPHKGMFLPYGTGCLLVRDGARLAAAHMGEADYLRDFDPSEIPSPAHLGPELSRPFRGLRLWLPLMLHGAKAFRDALEEKLALAQLCTEGIDRRIAEGRGLEIVARPQLSTVGFRLSREPGESLERWNQRNVRLLERINARNRAYLSSTLLPVADGSAVTLRVCVLSFRTHRERIDALLEDLDHALAQ